MNPFEMLLSGNWTVKLLGILILLLVAGLIFTKLIFIAVLVVLSFGVSYLVHSMQIRSVGLELATFTTIITSLAYGPIAGGIVGLLLISFHLAVSQHLGVYVAWVIPEYLLMGFIAGFFKGSVVAIGMGVILIIFAANIVFTAITYRQNIPKYLLYIATNLILNWVLFSILGQPLLNILSG